MSFLKKDLLEKVKNKTAPVQEHLILRDGPIPLSVRNAYLHGCVFAAMMDDGMVSETEKSKLYVIAKSLQLSEVDLEEGINAVSSCAMADRVGLLSEIIAQVKGEQYSLWFVIDFERMMAINENISEDGKEVLSFISEKLFARDDWRLAAWQLEKSNCTSEEFNRYFWAAEDGDRYAQRIVGHCYLDGEVIARDLRRGFKWLRRLRRKDIARHNLMLQGVIKLDGVQKLMLSRQSHGTVRPWRVIA